MDLATYLHLLVDPANYQWNWVALPRLIEASINLSLALFVFLKNPRARLNQVYLAFILPMMFWLICTSLYLCTWNVHVLGFYDRNIAQFLLLIVVIGFCWFTSVLFGLEQKRKPWIILGYVLALIIYSIIVLFPDVFLPDAVYHYSWGLFPKARPPYALIMYPYYVTYLSWGFLTYWNAYRITDSPAEKNKIRYLFIACFLLALSGLEWLPAWGIDVYPFGAFFGICFDAIMAYTIVYEKLFDIEALALKTTMWLATSAVVLAPLCLLFWFTHGMLINLTRSQALSLLVVLFLVFNFYWSTVQTRVDQFFQKRRYDLKQVLAEFVSDMAALKNLKQLQSQLSKILSTRLYVPAVSLFVAEEGAGHYRDLTTQDSVTPRMAVIAKEDPFIQWLQERNEIFDSDEIVIFMKAAPVALQEAVLKFMALNDNPRLIIPLATQAGFVGWIALGPRMDGKSYGINELEFLNQLRKNLAVAISNSLLYDQVQQFNASLEATVQTRTQELQAKTNELQQANERLKQLDVAKTEFLAMANHELRNPLSAVRGFSETLALLWDKLPEDKKRESVSHIYESSTHMLTLISDYLDVAKIELGRFDLNRTATRMSSLAEKAANQMGVQHKSLSFKVKFDDPGITLNVDADKIAQVLLNFAGNAAKYSPDKGTVTILGQKKDGQFVIAVEDEGPGIPEEHLNKLFNKFYRIETADPEARKGSKVKGTGLGLTIAKSIIEMHNGKIWVENRKDRTGARFCFSLPLS